MTNAMVPIVPSVLIQLLRFSVHFKVTDNAVYSDRNFNPAMLILRLKMSLLFPSYLSVVGVNVFKSGNI
jgi:hypothetical protein